MKFRGLLAALVVSCTLVGCPELTDGVRRGINECGGESAQLIQDAIHTGQTPSGGFDVVSFIFGVAKNVACIEPIVVDEIRRHQQNAQACAIASAADAGAVSDKCVEAKREAPGEEQRARAVIAIARNATRVSFDGGVK